MEENIVSMVTEEIMTFEPEKGEKPKPKDRDLLPQSVNEKYGKKRDRKEHQKLDSH
jgi:hypothetical protein